MSIVEVVGFVISLFFLLFLFTRPFQEKRQRKNHPEKYAAAQKRQEQQRRMLYEALGIKQEPEEEEEASRAVPQAVQRVKKQEKERPHRSKKDSINEASKWKPTPVASPYHPTLSQQKSRAAHIIAKQRSRQAMIVIQTILNRPPGEQIQREEVL